MSLGRVRRHDNLGVPEDLVVQQVSLVHFLNDGVGGNIGPWNLQQCVMHVRIEWFTHNIHRADSLGLEDFPEFSINKFNPPAEGAFLRRLDRSRP